MKYKFLFPFLISSLSLIFISCEDEPSDIGIELIAQDYLSTRSFDSQVDSIAQNSSYFKNVIPLSGSSWILIGKYQDIDASALLRFILGLADSLKNDLLDDKINVLDSWIVLQNRYVYGDTLASMDFTAHKVNSYWSSSFTIDSLSKLDYDTEDISSALTITDTTYTFNLDETLILSWMKNAADNSLESNYGIYLQPSATSGKVVGFEALTATSSIAAKLYVVIEKSGVYTDTLNGFIISDISLVNGSLPTLPAGTIGVQSSIAVNSKISFDISVLPKGIVINFAELILTKETVNSKSGSAYTNSLRAYYLTYSDSLKTEGSSVTLSFSNNKYSGNITGFLRSWIDNDENNGILIQSGNQFDGLELFSIYGSDAQNLSDRPRLRVTYTIKENL